MRAAPGQSETPRAASSPSWPLPERNNMDDGQRAGNRQLLVTVHGNEIFTKNEVNTKQNTL